MTIVLPDWPAWVYVLVVALACFEWGLFGSAGRDLYAAVTRRWRRG